MNCVDGWLFVGGVVVYARFCIAAGGIDRIFVCAAQMHTALLLFHCAEDMKKLAQEGALDHKKIPYEPGTIPEQVFMVLAATDDPGVPPANQ